MADGRDDKVSQRYRELGADAPPLELDRAIVQAARVAARRKHRWYGPLAAAAVVVFAVALTIVVERRQADPESIATSPPPSAEPVKPAAPSTGAQRARPPQPERHEARASPPVFAPDSAEQRQEAGAREEAGASARAEASLASEPPEKWLQRIAELRQQERHDEADRQLADFRKRYPDYRIPAATLEKVEKR